MDLNPDLNLRKKLAPGFDLDLDLSSLTGFGFDLDLQRWWICTPQLWSTIKIKGRGQY